ncbi:SAF domain-containing protein [Hephaestia caeni]|uniref:SAF domain-containing protein n=1 Tax=Hephaestia caeni TaxID=645617 RepID=A0A397PB97_9SPHN|nr:UxaA family hydrolase [Hephaestia caeni]RIA46830.1 SAF domain-containing protein [Hephaestia caeni]
MRGFTKDPRDDAAVARPGLAAAAGSPVIVLDTADNVAVCRRNVATGEALAMDGDVVAARADMPLGHKVARAFIPAGALVVKYGMPIGSATADIEPGDWVHLHNMRSNYISSHTRASAVPA